MIKRALVLSGGGAKGSYQIGALKALCEIGRSWNSVHGISVGALNAAWFAMYKPEDQAKSMSGLLEIWENVKSSKDIYRPWAPWKLNYIMSLWKGSLNTGAPLRKIISRFWDLEKARESGVKLTVGCCSLTTTKYDAIDQTNNNIMEYVLASSHLPIVFEPLLIDGELWVDGGVRHQIPILEALRENPDEIDVIVTQPPVNYNSSIVPNSSLKSAINVSLRGAGIFSDQVYFEDCLDIIRVINQSGKKHNIKVNFFVPRELPRIDSMNFDGPTMQGIIKIGYEETKAKLEKLEENSETALLEHQEPI
jgi:NTE family protein